jgi:hypothetical protein
LKKGENSLNKIKECKRLVGKVIIVRTGLKAGIPFVVEPCSACNNGSQDCLVRYVTGKKGKETISCLELLCQTGFRQKSDGKASSCPTWVTPSSIILIKQDKGENTEKNIKKCGKLVGKVVIVRPGLMTMFEFVHNRG